MARGNTSTITNVVFQQNTSTGFAGALWAYGSCHLDTCTFENNAANAGGGAMEVRGSVVAQDSRFADNQAGVGGAAYVVARILRRTTAISSRTGRIPMAVPFGHTPLWPYSEQTQHSPRTLRGAAAVPSARGR